MSPIARRLCAVAYVLGLASAAVAWVLICAWLAPPPGPMPQRIAPSTYRCNELAPVAPRETWEQYEARMKAENKKIVR